MTVLRAGQSPAVRRAAGPRLIHGHLAFSKLHLTPEDIAKTALAIGTERLCQRRINGEVGGAQLIDVLRQ